MNRYSHALAVQYVINKIKEHTNNDYDFLINIAPRAMLIMIMEEASLLDQLRKGIKPVKTIEADALDTENRYLTLLARSHRLSVSG